MHRLPAVFAALVAAVFVFIFLPTPALPSNSSLPPGSWKVIAWNDLGMHCMDSDYSVFSILPPFNNLQAQLIQNNGSLVESANGLSVTYEGVTDPSGSINTTSVGKTGFWNFSQLLYGGSTIPDTGLMGFNMPGSSNTPRAMAFDPSKSLFHAEGIPITPYDDAGHKRHYPLIRVVARNSVGTPLASTNVVLPVSDEMDCSLCHLSGSGLAARPSSGWVNHPDQGKDYRLNILKLHDENHLNTPLYQSALTTAGYPTSGLLASAQSGVPVLCARCHASNALPGTGISGISRLTRAIHAGHQDVIDPMTGVTLDSSTNRASCYRCHPGSDTRCLRGAMGSAVGSDGGLAMQCQSCHGSMSVVGDASRVGWLDQPNCQNCHTGTATNNNGQIRYTSAFGPNGSLRVAVNSTFATKPNVPSAGFSLYRLSVGHGGLSCEACHGATHAEYPALHPNDNLQSVALQGHVGTISDCTACHNGTPETFTGGPHGLHPIGNPWIDHHGDAAQTNGLNSCRICHGADLRGTVLSQALGDRSLSLPWGNRSFWRGARISCWACHDGPNDDDPTSNHDPVAQNASAISNGTVVTITLLATDVDANPLTFRIVGQPAHGRVALAANVATYYPEPGHAGPDNFTFAASDSFIESNLATVTVTRGAEWANYGRGVPGTGGVVPSLTLSDRPVNGSTISIQFQNTSTNVTSFGLIISNEIASIPAGSGGLLLCEPTNIVLGTLPANGMSIPWTIPTNPTLTGAVILGQFAQLDAGAPFGIAFSSGIRIVLGA